MAERREDLPGEGGARGLAVGAGDGDAGSRLDSVEGRGRPGVGATGVEHAHHGQGGGLHRPLGEDRGGAGGDGGGNEGAAVRVGARQRGEKEAWLHLATVGGDTGDSHIGAGQRVAKQVGEAAPGQWSSPSWDASTGDLGAKSDEVMTRGTPTKGSMRSITRRAVGAAVSAPVVTPPSAGVGWGSSSMTRTR